MNFENIRLCVQIVTVVVDTTTSLEALQSDEQRLVLDTVAQIRKCGLDSILSLPQLVVCGDQSAGKSSVLEALTEIPFPRNDELCTRFATEIILRRSTVESLTVKVIPDNERPFTEKEPIKAFKESITDLNELPDLIERAKTLMGISSGDSASRAFARDVLSIEIEGPTRPQLTLVDLPGLIQNETKGVTKADVDMVAEITDHYISQSRTICLAVISATNDYANQGVLTKVRKVDPEGNRTLGIITKPDRLIAGSGSETAYINLAKNEDVFFKLGWHVVRNRSFEDTNSTFLERNATEAFYFRKSNFNCLPKTCVGIDTLRERLSLLLFEHVQQELPKLRVDLTKTLEESEKQLSLLGSQRSTATDCKDYLVHLSLEFYNHCKLATNGYFEGSFFNYDANETFLPTSPSAVRRLRAVVQMSNAEFSETIRRNGHTYYTEKTGDVHMDDVRGCTVPPPDPDGPLFLSRAQSIRWAWQTILRNRGRELSGNFNPLVIGELLWQQSLRWRSLTIEHLENIASACHQFLDCLLKELCPKDVHTRVWSAYIQDALNKRKEAAFQELDLIIEDLKGYPINYNHYYTDNVRKNRLNRERGSLAESLEAATKHTRLPGCNSDHTSASIDVNQVVEHQSEDVPQNAELHGCDEALDGVVAIYKVCGIS